MSMIALRSSQWMAKASDFLAQAGQWWLREFLSLFPARVTEWLMDGRARRLVLKPAPEAVSLDLINDRRQVLASTTMNRAGYSPALIDSFLKSNRLKRRDVALGVRLDPNAIFRREVMLPVQAAPSIGAVLEQELLRKTPFRLQDVYHDHVLRRTGEKLQVSHWVVRRQFAADALDALGLGANELAFVDADGADDGTLPPVVRLRNGNAASRWTGKILLALTLSALLLAIIAGVLKYRQQQAVLDQLAVQIPVAKAKAQQVRSVLEATDLTRKSTTYLRKQKRDQPGLIDVWEEVSTILPSTSWLTELRVSEASDGKQQITLTGFSDAAANLVSVIDRSPLFADATLTAPISLDPTEQKERFVIQATVEKREPSREASR